MRILSAHTDLLTVYCDGAARGNPGPAGIGVQVTDRSGGTVHEIARGIGEATNNVAEYSAVIAALEWCLDNGAQEVLVRSDSHLLVEQMSGRYKVKNAKLRTLHGQALGLAKGFRRVSYEHVYREYNERADELANRGVDSWLAGEGRGYKRPKPGSRSRLFD